uniref:Uncharacterized protein LOC104217770 n=1 Tax=Nicotiana sylvestris TaxID=4096 RepID=A0A1U7VN46_NICSY|nr:PREDICTED: uncharacterized protein LOC104217770 [Nicotiana sylvestris]
MSRISGLDESVAEAINNVGTNIWKPSIEYTAEDYSHVMVLGNEFKLYVVMNYK